jgi:hypothetical protein
MIRLRYTNIALKHIITNRRILVFFFLLSLTLCLLVARFVFYFSYMEPDSTSYLFQAKIFASGRLSLPPPPDYGFSSSPHINILNGKWYSKYPFGNALILSLGVIIHAPWIVAPLLSTLTLMVIYFIIKEIYGKNLSIVAMLLTLFSPAFLIMSGLWISENTSRFFIALFLLFLLKSLNRYKWYYAVISGFALGYAFNTRPVAAVGFGLACGVFVLYRLFTSEKKQEVLKTMGTFLIPFIFMILVCLAWNKHMTGDALKFTHNAAQPYDKIGFGLRSEGYDVDISKGYLFTPQIAAKRLFKYVLPCIFHNVFGWGKYHSYGLGYSSKTEHIISFLPIILTFILMMTPFFSRYRCQYDFLLLGIFLSVVFIYFFFYFDGSTFGDTAAHARYYNEVTLFAIIPLAIKGLYIIFRRLSPLKPLMISALVLVIALYVNTGFTLFAQAKALANYSPVYQQLPRMVKSRQIHNAVIFIQYIREAPIGDYPFKSLDEADIVYFRLGPSPAWGLTKSNWQSVWEQYFNTRDAYAYDEGSNRLWKLDAGSFNTKLDKGSRKLVGKWKFDEGLGSSALDSSGNGNDGSLKGQARWVANGKAGFALDFNGKDSYVEIPDSESLQIPNSATVSIWVYPRSYPNDKPTILCKGGNHQDFDIIMQKENGGVWWYLSSVATDYVVTTSNPIPIGQWTHLAVTYKADDSIAIYVNGELSGYTPITDTRSPSLNPLYIGKSFWSDRFFDGLIDEVNIYQGCLSQNEIKKLAIR